MTTCGVQLDTVSAGGLWFVMFVMIVVMVIVLTEVVVSVPSGVRLMDVAAREAVAIVQLSATAGQDTSASGYHLGSEGKLLAVKDESSLVVIKIVLSVLAVLA